MNTIPPIEREEWKKIISGEMRFAAFAPRLMVDRLKRRIEKEELSLEGGVKEMFLFFQKYNKAYNKDLKLIFKSW